MNFDIIAYFQGFFGNTSAFTVTMWLIGVIVVIVLLRKSWPTISGFVKTVDALGDLPEALKKLDTIEENLKVLDELRPNHGGSIRDHVTKISKQTLATSAKLDEHIDLCKLIESAAIEKPVRRRTLEDVVENS
jgi:hypothetical protein